jgi:hypothetical protein
MKNFKLSLYLVTALILLDYCMNCLTIEDTPHVVKIAVMGTNDLHGTAFPKSLYRKDSK